MLQLRGTLCEKSFIVALAALAATASFAQSSVTAYGVFDTGFRSVESGTNKFSGMANGSNASNRLGFKGTEDLGGGMKGNFVLEGDLAPNDGTAAGFAFRRQSTIGLEGAFGEVRLGRDYTPAFRVFGIVDPFGTVGVGSAGNILWSTVKGAPDFGGIDNQIATYQAAQDAANAASTFVTVNRGTTGISSVTPAAKSAATLPPTIAIADPNVVRANNSFAYYSPAFMGVKAALMYSAGNQNTATERAQGKMTGLSLTYAQGPLTVAYANQVTKGGYVGANTTGAAYTPFGGTLNATTCTDYGGTPVQLKAGDGGNDTCQTKRTTGAAASDDQKYTTNFLAGSYDFGVAKAGLGYREEKLELGGDMNAKIKGMIYSVSAPVGAVTLKASYITKKADGEKLGNQLAIGAVYDLSKRTALYATYAELKNEAGFANSVGSAAASATGIKSKGYDIGVRHSF